MTHSADTTAILRHAGLRRTRARQAVLESLARTNRPLSHQEITSDPDLASLDRVTLYRTLTALQKAGLLHRVKGVDGVWRFCGNQTEKGHCAGNHVHFLCLDCNQMSCLPEQPLPWIDPPDGAEVFGKQLVVYGHCVACAAKRQRAKV